MIRMELLRSRKRSMIDYFLFGNRQPDNEQIIKEALEAKVNALARREEYGRRLNERHREGTV